MLRQPFVSRSFIVTFWVGDAKIGKASICWLAGPGTITHMELQGDIATPRPPIPIYTLGGGVG